MRIPAWPQSRATVELWAILLTLGLGGCASAPTPYQPAAPDGYRQQQIEVDRFRVTFSGNAATPRETVENYLLYRCAELTLERGYDHFLLAEQNVAANTRYYRTFTGYPGFGYYRYGLYGYPYGVGFGGVASSEVYPVNRFEASATIVLGRGQPRQDGPEVLDAREVIRFLGPVVERPPTE
ncbi:MAG: hypothetical protein ACFCBW_00300 [Candidatus Competibacterales bacterium]